MNNYYFCGKVINNLNILIALLYKSNNYSDITAYKNKIIMSDFFLIKNKMIITKEIDRNYNNRYLRIYEKPFFKDYPIGIIQNKNNIASLNYYFINNNLCIVNLLSNNNNLLLAFIFFCINIAKNKKINKIILNINISIEFYFILLKSFQIFIYSIKYYNDNFILFNGYLYSSYIK